MSNTPLVDAAVAATGTLAFRYDVLKRRAEKVEEELTAAESALASVTGERDAARRDANRRSDAIAAGVFETVQDAAATWDTACDELIWGNYDSNGPQCQPVTPQHLDATCVRFPQWAKELRDFAVQWNEDDHSITDEMLAAVEIDDESVKRTQRWAMNILNYYNKLRAVEKRADEAEAKLREQDALLARCAVMFETGNTISVPRELHSEFGALKMDLDKAISKPPCQK